MNYLRYSPLDPAEVEDREAAYAVSWLSDTKPSERITPENRQLLKSEVGARAIIDLEKQKALVVCPASLREMWERELASAT